MADRAEDQIELITEELEDLDRQIADGELDADTADELRTKFVAELDQLMSKSGAQVTPKPHGEGPTPKGGRLSARALAGTAVVAIAITAIGVFAVNSLSDTSTAGAEGVAGEVVAGQGAVDLSDVSTDEMESVVAENPDITGMRMALARRYFEAGEFDKALDHYMVVLEDDKNPEALANVGWMTYLSDRPDIALGYVEAALQRQPGMLTATWYLAQIQYTLGDFDASRAALSVILGADAIPDEVKDAARILLSQMEDR